MREFTINEISAVDVPAQSGATMVLMKRHNKQKGDKMDEMEIINRHLEQLKQELAALESTEMAGEENAAATAETEMTTKECADKEKEMMAAKSAKIAEIMKSIETGLAKAQALYLLDDAEKTHLKSLKEEDKDAFIAKSKEERAGEIKKASEEDAVVYKCIDGTEYRKSDDPRLVAMAKRADEADKLAKAEVEKNIKAALEKRAEVEMNFIKGNSNAKVALLKSIDGIKDESVKTEVLEIIKSANEAMSPAFQTLGVTKAEEEPKDAKGKLESLAKKYAKDNNVSNSVAMDAVLKTAEGKKLYNETQTK